MRKIIIGLLAFGFVGVGVGLWTCQAADEAAPPAGDQSAPAAAAPAAGGAPAAEGAPAAAPAVEAAAGACCKAGDTTPPVELVKQVPPGQLHSPYQDYAKLATDDPDLVKRFRLPGCNECHGGNGGGGMCPALTQGIWFWGNTDDVLFRLVTLGSADLEKSGFTRIQFGSVHAPMPPMGFAVKTSDELWKIIAFIRSINPPGTNPPEKMIPGRMTADAPH